MNDQAVAGGALAPREVAALAGVSTDTLRHYERKGMRRLTRADRRQLSLVDCVSFETMEREPIHTALAVDEHFREAGFRVVP